MSYPPPYGYGAPGGYGAPPVYGAPAYGAPVYGAPVAYQAQPMYAAMPPPPPGFVIPAYTPGMYTYQTPYVRTAPFMVPYGMPPHLAAKMMQASAAFRAFDTNWSGGLSKKEWKHALRHLGYFIPKGYTKHLFHMVDRDYSGRISEREFCEWWLATQPY